MEVSNHNYNSIMPDQPVIINNQNSNQQSVVHIPSDQVDAAQVNAALRANALASVPSGFRELGSIELPFCTNKAKLYQLDNGQRVIILPKQGPTMLRTFVRVGAMNEPDRIKGISHYIEHNLFNGSKNLAPNEFVSKINQMGAEYNASTSHNVTEYYIKSPLHTPQDLEKLIGMHADMILYPSFHIQSLDKEKGPVISEIHMYQDSPENIANNLMIKNLFNIQTDIPDLIAGTDNTIGNLTRQDVLDYFNTWYRPDNMTTVVVGDVNSDQTIRMLSKHFNSKMPASQNPTQPAYYLPLNNPIQATKRVDIRNPNVQSTFVNMAFAGPTCTNIRETFALDALCCMMGGYNNARLKQSLKKYNTEPLVGKETLSANPNDPQMVVIKANFKTGDEEEGLKTIYSTLYELAFKAPSDIEMQIIKNKMKNALTFVSESSRGITSFIGDAIINHGDLRVYAESLNIINSLTPADIQNAARKFIDLNKTSIVVVHPESQVIGLPSQKLTRQPVSADSQVSKTSFKGRNKKLSFGRQASNFKLNNVSEYNLTNNLHLAINDDPEAARTNVIIKLKSDIIPMVKPGVAEILAFMLDDGTKQYTKEQISEISDINSIRIKADASNNSILVAADSSSENVPLTLKLMKEVFFNPSFTEEKFRKAKEEIKVNYLGSMKSPYDRAIETLYCNNPYGYSARRIYEELDKVQLQDVVDFYNYIVQNSQGNATVTGSALINPHLQQALFTELQSGIPNVHTYHYASPAKFPVLSGNQVITEAEERNQAHIVQAFKIDKSGNVKDTAALYVLNKILGGNSHSRLFMDLREKQKLAYRVGSHYSSDSNTGTLALQIMTTTKNGDKTVSPENVVKSLEGFKKHINDLISNPVSQEELEGAKLSVKSELMFRYEDSSGKNALASAGFETPYGADYLKEFLNAVDNLTESDIQKAANAYLNQPSVISIIASKDTINNTKDYLRTQGNLTSY